MGKRLQQLMPEDERDTDFDPTEDYPWDCDLTYPLDLEQDDDDEDED